MRLGYARRTCRSTHDRMPSMPSLMPLADLQRSIEALITQQRYAEAAALLHDLVEREPHSLPARMQLAHVLLQDGRFEGSARELVAAVAVPDDDPAGLIALARRLSFHGEMVQARRCIDRLERLRGTAHLHAAIAHLRWMTGEVERALTWIERAYREGLRAPDELLLQAMLCHFLGDNDRAERLLDECLAQAPDFGMAAQARANLRRQSPEHAHIDALRQQIVVLRTRSSAHPAHALNLAQFEAALAKELDDLGEIPAAWEALSRSKGILRALNPYDAAAESAITRHLVEAIRDCVPATPFRPVADTGQATPIFIVGMPRSGSTLLDRMISAHPDVAPAGELNDFLRQLHRVADVPPAGHAGMHRVLDRLGSVDPAELGRRYLAQAGWRAGDRRYFVDKLPINVQLVPLIRRALPHAPILHLVRDPMDVCFSNFRAMFGDVSPWCNDLAWTAHFHGCYRQLVDTWHADYPGAMIDLAYADLVADPEAVMRFVLPACGLAFDDACLHPERNPFPVTTPSAAQVREPLNGRGMASWKRYAGPLEPLRRALDAAGQRVA
ncbi:MAG: sulfotransferase [Xanthomonadaceae bacterium]|nr:sulfotransferase [Xanthomonadaceae bacterium]